MPLDPRAGLGPAGLRLAHLSVPSLILPPPGGSASHLSINPIGPICGVLGAICGVGSGLASGLGSGIAGGLAQDVLGEIVQWVVNAATWLLDQIGAVLTATTTVDLNASWFRSHYQVMVGIAVVIVVPMMLSGILQAIVRQDPSPMIRMVLVQLPLSAILTMVAVKVIDLALTATDALSSTVGAGANGNIDKVLTGLYGGIMSADGSGVLPGLVLLVVGLLIVVAAFMLWVELLMRAAAIYAAVLFLPLVLVSSVWPAAAQWSRRLIETIASLILSKFVIVAVLSLAASAVASGTAGNGASGAGFASVLGGGALLLLAAFTPFTILRLIPLAEASVATHLDGARHRVGQSLGLAPGGHVEPVAKWAMRQARGNGAMPDQPAGTGAGDQYLQPDFSVGTQRDPLNPTLAAGAGEGAAAGAAGAAGPMAAAATAAAGAVSSGVSQVAGLAEGVGASDTSAADGQGSPGSDATQYYAAMGIGPSGGGAVTAPRSAEDIQRGAGGGGAGPGEPPPMAGRTASPHATGGDGPAASAEIDLPGPGGGPGAAR